MFLAVALLVSRGAGVAVVAALATTAAGASGLDRRATPSLFLTLDESLLLLTARGSEILSADKSTAGSAAAATVEVEDAGLDSIATALACAAGARLPVKGRGVREAAGVHGRVGGGRVEATEGSSLATIAKFAKV